MRFHIQISFGQRSTLTLSNVNTSLPFQGILQGNREAPATWVIISTPLLNMLRVTRNGGQFVSSISKEMTHLVDFPFMDDMDLLSLHMNNKNITFDENADKM